MSDSNERKPRYSWAEHIQPFLSAAPEDIESMAAAIGPRNGPYLGITVPDPAIRSEIEWRIERVVTHGVDCHVRFTLSSTDMEAMNELGNALSTAIQNVLRDFQP